MEINWNSKYIDLKNLISIARGDKDRMLKYLNQFMELIPQRIENLNEYLLANDRKMIRQTLHRMSPQIQFFGIPDVVAPIRRLEHEYETMPLEELELLVKNILTNLDKAINEIESVINNNF